ncbi:MAG: MFS transporter, partial [Candidatus Nanopelagicales bacterium]
ADRYDRHLVMLVSDVLRGLLMSLLAIAVLSDGPLLVLLALVAAASIAGAPYSPAVGVVIPSIVGEADLAAANALTRVADNIAITLGPVLGSVLLVLGSASLAITLNAATYLVSAVLLWRIRGREPGDSAPRLETFRQHLRAGFDAVNSSANILLLVLVSFGFTVTFGMEIVLFPLVAENLLGTGTDGLGWLLGASGVGSVLGAWAAGHLAARPRTALLLIGSAIVAALPLLCLTVINQPAVAYAVLVFEGAGFAVANVIAVTTIQRVAPGHVIGRVFGVLTAVLMTGILVGNLIAGIAVGVIGLRATMAVGSGFLIVCGFAGLPRARRLDRDAAKQAAATAELVASLQRLRIFDGAPQVTLESLARTAVEVPIAAGEVVISEGDVADALFVISAGQFLVTPVGRTLSPDDYFGEIGVLEGVPRTATVTATTDGTLYRIGANDFVAALNEAPTGMRHLAGTLSARLARTHPNRPANFTGHGPTMS